MTASSIIPMQWHRPLTGIKPFPCVRKTNSTSSSWTSTCPKSTVWRPSTTFGSRCAGGIVSILIVAMNHRMHFNYIHFVIISLYHRHTNNQNQYTPIIAFTSSGTLEDYQQYGVQDMLQKPFTQETLSAMFDRWTPYTKGLGNIYMRMMRLMMMI